MSYANQDIHNAAGPGSSAEPSMEEILASIRRILKEDEPGKPAEPNIAAIDTAPVDMDDDILVLDESMIARPADLSSATTPPPDPLPEGEHQATPLAPGGAPIHVSSEPLPFARDFEPAARANPEPILDITEMPQDNPQALPAAEPAFKAPFPAAERGATGAGWAAWPSRDSELEPAPAERGRLWDSLPGAPEADRMPAEPAPEPTSQATFEPPTEHAAAPTAPTQPGQTQEPDMNDSAENAFQPPESLISDKATDAAASSIGALVRSMTAEKSVAISKGSSITIEDIVRDEIRPLLKSWLDSHLPSLVERIVRTEIERVISRSVV